jgi:GNAT superfamily N-acetyltransferase
VSDASDFTNGSIAGQDFSMSETTLGIRQVAPSSPDSHLLDTPAWSALATHHRGIAEGDTLARRYPVAFAPFGGIADTSPESFTALRNLVPPGDRVAMFTPYPVRPTPQTLNIVLAKTAHQMTGTWIPETAILPLMTPLGTADIPEMMQLVEVTQPGPFGLRTQELGTYLGVRIGDRLVAMAGERMKLDGYVEISAVCTHPDVRGFGYAAALVTALSRAALERGEIPFLHVFSDNDPAIALYHKVGFRIRRTLHLTVLGSPDHPEP